MSPHRIYCPIYDATILAVRSPTGASTELVKRLKLGKRYRDGANNRSFRVTYLGTLDAGGFLFRVQNEGHTERMIVMANRTISLVGELSRPTFAEFPA